MSLWQNLLLTDAAILMTAVVGGIGWTIKRLVTRSETRIAQDTNQNTKIELLQFELSNLKADLLRDKAQLTSWQDRVDRRVAALGEEQASLAVLQERHEAFHERHGGVA